jgi:hypothetical protein
MVSVQPAQLISPVNSPFRAFRHTVAESDYRPPASTPLQRENARFFVVAFTDGPYAASAIELATPLEMDREKDRDLDQECHLVDRFKNPVCQLLARKTNKVYFA